VAVKVPRHTREGGYPGQWVREVRVALPRIKSGVTILSPTRASGYLRGGR